MIWFIKIIDRYIGPIVIIPLTLLKSRDKKNLTKKNMPQNILVLKLWALGDSVLTLTLIEKLKKKYPESKISVLVRERNKTIYQNNKFIEKIHFIYEIPQLIRKFDLVYDCEPYLNISSIFSRLLGHYIIGFSHGMRSLLYDKKTEFKMQHMVKNYINMINPTLNVKNLNPVGTSNSDEYKVEKFVKKNLVKKIAGITIGAAESATINRMWPKERFAEIGDYLNNLGYVVIFVGSPNESKLIRECQSLMKSKSKSYFSGDYFNLSQTICLISKFKIFVSNDTGPMHIAAAQGVKTIGLFGANTPTLWGPYGEGNISLYHQEKCSPCIDNTKGKMPPCHHHHKCILKITVEEVKSAINKIID